MFRRTVAPGIELRQIELGDAEPMFRLVERNRERLGEWLPWVEQARTAEDIREFIRRVDHQVVANQGPNAVIWVDGIMAGTVGCHPIDWANRNCSLGYWIDASQQGKGVITRCCATLIDYLFDEMALHRVEIRCGTGNRRSCAVPERLGFMREGVAVEAEWVGRWVDLVVWGMVDHRWRQLPGARR